MKIPRSKVPKKPSTKDLAKALSPNVENVQTVMGARPLNTVMDFAPRVRAAFAWASKVQDLQRAFPQGHLSTLRIAKARVDLKREIDSTPDKELDKALDQLRYMVGEKVAPKSGKELRELARKQADRLFPMKADKTVREGALKSTSFDDMRIATELSDEIDRAYYSFMGTLKSGNQSEITHTGNVLKAVLKEHGKKAGLKPGEIDRCQKAVNQVVGDHISRLPAGNADKVLEGIFRALLSVDRASEISPALSRLSRFLSTDDWYSIANYVARMPEIKPGKAESATAAVDSLKSVYGEITARKGSYRHVRDRSRRFAESFVERPGMEQWEVLGDPLPPLRMLKKQDPEFALSLDDAVIVINPTTNKAAILLAGQFKSGDASSAEGLAQVANDILREQGGKILIGGKLYDLELDLVETRRVLVGTKLSRRRRDNANPREMLLTTEVTFIKQPVEPNDLKLAALFVLRSVGKIKD